MRRIVLVASLLLAQPVHADLIVAPSPPPDPERGNFWRDMIAPHQAEVAAILFKAKNALGQADSALASDYDPSGQERLRFYREVLGALRYARRLQPDNIDVLRLLAQTSDELGLTRQAIEALQAAIDVTGASKAPADLTGRLGIIYLRLGKLDDAIRYLRLAQGPLVPNNSLSAQVLVHLSNALAMRGQVGDAIDLLANAVPANIPYYSTDAALVAFSLAVQYDRDEQHGAAFDVLDRMQTVLQGQMAALVQTALASMRFAPAEDQHYYLGLLYEAVGSYPEARAEWALYAAAPDMPYRERALDHIAAIDAQRRAAPPAAAPVPRRYRGSPDPAQDVYDSEMKSGDELAIQANVKGASPKTIRQLVDHAVLSYQNAAKAKPNDAEPYFRIGRILYSFYFECEDSVSQTNQSPLCYPDITLFDRKHAQEIIDAWGEFEKRAPLDPRLSVHLGESEILFKRAILNTKLFTKDHLEAAAHDYEKILARSDSSGDTDETVWSNLAETYMMLDRLEDAIDMYQEAIRRGPSTSTMYGLAVALDRDERTQAARDVIQSQGADALEAFHNSVMRGGTFFVPRGEEYYYFALAHESFDDIDAAIEYWQKYIQSGAHPEYQPRAKAHLAALTAKRHPIPHAPWDDLLTPGH